LGLRWEQDMDKPRGNKWLLIISLVVGLSLGSLHGFINNLCNRFSFFKNYKVVTLKNFIIANIVVIAVLLFIFKLFLPLTMDSLVKPKFLW
jgi:hypothetical protein